MLYAQTQLGRNPCHEKLSFLADILRYFNPAIAGASHGYGKSDSDLDVAVSGAKSP